MQVELVERLPRIAGDITLKGSILSGWAARSGSSDPLLITVSVGPDWSTKILADIYRKDLQDAGIGNGHHAFSVQLPSELFDNSEADITITSAETGDHALEARVTLTYTPALVLESSHHRVVRGWCDAGPNTSFALMELTAGGKVVDAAVCGAPAPDLIKAGCRNGGRFELRIPPSLRISGHPDLAVRCAARPDFAVPAVASAGSKPPRILFVANASSPDDASRTYRAELPAKALCSIGVDASVISEEDARNNRIDKTGLGDWDVVILQRVPMSGFSAAVRDRASRDGAVVLYDTDDLMFKPWRRSEMGVIRSGTHSIDDAKYIEALQLRQELLLACDGAIVSTPYLQRELLTLGKQSILTRNALEDDMFTWGARRFLHRRERKEGLKLLFMSGSPTHLRDLQMIEPALMKILVSFPDVSLTLLGHIGGSKLAHLPNVQRIQRQDRRGMMKQITEHDLVLVPLERTGFNTGKSSLKFMECAAAGVPILASPLYEFRRDLRACGAGFVCNDIAEWESGILRFMQDPQLTYELGVRGHRYAAANYKMSLRGQHMWDEILRYCQYLEQTRIESNRIAARISSRIRRAG